MYIDQDGMTKRFGLAVLIALTDRDDPPTGGVVSAVLDQALADAAATIHGYARTAGYQVPFAPAVPDQVVKWQADLAYYNLHSGAIQVPDKLAADNKALMAQLRDLADGRLKLEVAGAEAPDAGDHQVILADAPTRIFDRVGLGRF